MMINFLECPAELQKLQPVFLIAKDIINIIKIGVPILLIVWGMIDFGKAVVGKDEAEIKKSQGAFVKRLISAVAVFLIITIISLALRIIDKYLPDENAMGWYDCLDLGTSGGGTPPTIQKPSQTTTTRGWTQ